MPTLIQLLVHNLQVYKFQIILFIHKFLYFLRLVDGNISLLLHAAHLSCFPIQVTSHTQTLVLRTSTSLIHLNDCNEFLLNVESKFIKYLGELLILHEFV